METAQTKIARLDRSIARAGESVKLERTQSDSEGVVSVIAEQTVPAHIRSTQPQDLVAAGTAEVRVVVSASQLGSYGIPKTDDRIYIHDVRHNVQVIAPIYYGNQLVRVNLLCRG